MLMDNRIGEFEPKIAEILAALCYHLHPEIVSYIQEANRQDRPYFERLFSGRIPLEPYLFDGSACVFPGVRRYVSGQGQTRAFDPEHGAILDSNEFPRHIWCFLLKGNAYGGAAWKSTGLAEFELAHVFSHKPSELELEKRFFSKFNEDSPPFGNFTCAANVALLPKGTVRPTDNSAVIKAVFFKRHVELYGESTLAGRQGFKDEAVPTWYGDLEWNAPLLPPNWRSNIEKLLQYRRNKIASIMAKANEPQAA